MSEEAKGEEMVVGKALEDDGAEFKDVKMATILTGQQNPRGIPFVVFIESVQGILDATTGSSVETLIGAFNELHQKFKILESTKMRTKQNMKTKIPEISRTLELVKHLVAQQTKDEAFYTNYSLSEMLYARAKIEPAGVVYLWLGASIMVEYPYAEALQMLQLSLGNAQDRLLTCNEDLDHVRDQIITVEVNMARVFNYDVKKRREDKTRAADAAPDAIAA
ncbi:Prefoldin subunit-domain-containing protein [Pelagophyceae sp. CCMP2097]|nr:Prefoldin subunit-domain-containing protein [Pelagophyceae sp. CCMP2097]|eukprot:CAMPEP_0184111382 /NCGR_PEP_ID=MMETSP0974-20121125/17879_1 /TAXON_ID=483370 /ORGANISM="non described non described, Strain CCMP2097" /LENGTH=220 /DNA_ID=CAMNT_0026414459 /DNA_START=20 /DNA_END=682 /DNA_ORIENTATION=+